jgi:hypothetical protein
MYEHLVVQIPGEGFVIDGVQRKVIIILLAHLVHQRSPKTKQVEKVVALQNRRVKKVKWKI